VRYFVYAFFYVVFAVEAVFIYPWAVVVSRHGFGLATLAEMGVFVAFLAATLIYAWRRGVLAWV
jgi:NADH-quinone oxidoreductase subunit A